MKITKVNHQNFNLIERLAMSLSSAFDGQNTVWKKLDGYFEYPNMIELFCDDVIVENGKQVPQSFMWRRWLDKAWEMSMTTLSQSNPYGISFQTIGDVKMPEKEEVVIEIAVPIKAPQMIPKFSKEATDVEN